jgi:hypothetical protein
MVLNVQGSYTEDSCSMGCDTGSVDEQFHIFQSMAVPSPAGKTHLRWSDPEDEDTITFQNAKNYLPKDTV